MNINYFSIFHETVGQIAEYEREVEEAARKMELIIRLSLFKEKKDFFGTGIVLFVGSKCYFQNGFL